MPRNVVLHHSGQPRHVSQQPGLTGCSAWRISAAVKLAEELRQRCSARPSAMEYDDIQEDRSRVDGHATPQRVAGTGGVIMFVAPLQSAQTLASARIVASACWQTRRTEWSCPLMWGECKLVPNAYQYRRHRGAGSDRPRIWLRFPGATSSVPARKLHARH
jgi:hypothetical protein